MQYLSTLDQTSFTRVQDEKLPDAVEGYASMTFTLSATKDRAQEEFKKHLTFIERELDSLILRAEENMLITLDTRSRYLQQAEKSILDL